jgi:hypothetical protein
MAELLEPPEGWEEKAKDLYKQLLKEEEDLFVERERGLMYLDIIQNLNGYIAKLKDEIDSLKMELGLDG